MKRFFKCLIISLLVFIPAFSLVGCNFGKNPPPTKDYNADIQVVSPENINTEHFEIKDNTTYYTSPGFSLWISVNGHFMNMNYFSIDGDKRIYDDLYFYEDDYFYIVTDDYVDLFASLSEESDKQYAEEEKEQGYDIQLNIIKSGIYKVIFDTKTLKFDLEYKSEIETPRYYTIKNCDIFSVTNSWLEMSINPNNTEEFYVTNYHIDTNKTISFFSHLHTSNYKPTLEVNSQKYAKSEKHSIRIFIGGNYNIYINSKTYEVRLELINVETADYTCVYYDGSDFIDLELVDSNIPYIFTYQLDVDTKYSTSLPHFYNNHYSEYKLSVVSSPELMSSGKYHYFKTIGTYKITINLKTFEISAELLPE